MKKIISTTIILSLLLSLFTFTVSANETVNVVINRGINFEYLDEEFIPYDKTIKSIVYPITYKDRTYIPARFLAEGIGWEVSWDEATQTVGFEDNGTPAKSYEVEHGDRTPYQDTAIVNKNIRFTVNGEPFVPTETDGSICYPLTYKDRTYIPARFIAEKAGLSVVWVEDTQTIKLDYATDEEEKEVIVPTQPNTPAIPNTPSIPTDTPSIPADTTQPSDTMFEKATEAAKVLVLGATVTEDGKTNKNTASNFPNFSHLVDENYGVYSSEENNVSVSGTTIDLKAGSVITIIFNVKNLSDFENYLKTNFPRIMIAPRGYAMAVGNSLGCTIEINKNTDTIIFSIGDIDWYDFLNKQ